MNKMLEQNLAWLAKRGISVSQNRDDLEQLYEFMLQQPRVDVFVEIGVWQGGTLLLFSQFVKPHGLVIGIDKYDSPRRNDNRNRRLADSVVKRLADIRNLDVHIVPEYSRDALPAVKALLGSRQVDYLHIDGDHTYAAAKADFDAYRPLVRSGGLIQIHDIKTSDKILGAQPTSPDARGFVREYWADLKPAFAETHEFANETERPSVTGIGVVRV